MRVCIFAQLAVMNPGTIETYGCADIRLKRSAKGQMSADAEAGRGQLPFRNFGMFAEVIKGGAAILIEFRDRGFRGVVQTAGASGVIKRNRTTCWFDAMVDLRSGHNEAVTGKPGAGSQHWSGKLKDIGVKDHARKFAVGLGCGDQGSHRAAAG